MSPSGPPRCTVYRQAVRYLECDQQGVVFNMWYLGYFDEAFGTFLTEGGLSYAELIAGGVDVQLVHSDIDWVVPLRWGDEAEVEVRLGRVGRTSFAVDFVVRAAGRVDGTGAPTHAATGRTVYVVVATDGSGVRPVPPFLAAALGAPPG